jgi:hypothetical protein
MKNFKEIIEDLFDVPKSPESGEFILQRNKDIESLLAGQKLRDLHSIIAFLKNEKLTKEEISEFFNYVLRTW